MANAAQRLSQMAKRLLLFPGMVRKDETGVSILDKVLHKLVKQIRNEDLRRDKTTFGIVDAQSVQNADTAEEKGYDAGKKYPESNATLS